MNGIIDEKSLFKIPYGLYVLTSNDGEKDNGCIINTVMQVTNKPNRISIAVNKLNFTHDMIKKSGVFNVSVLTESVPFSVFERFGFKSGKDTDKFAGFEHTAVSQNGLKYLTAYTNALISGKVVSSEDCGTHTVFIADVTQAEILSDEKSVTYDYYFANIKPKPAVSESKKKRYVCKICGYVYEGDELPDDFICPLCKHGAEDFELVE
ncbi:MAG: flavin reductase [Oscillospiraceae bacterium]